MHFDKVGPRPDAKMLTEANPGYAAPCRIHPGQAPHARVLAVRANNPPAAHGLSAGLHAVSIENVVGITQFLFSSKGFGLQPYNPSTASAVLPNRRHSSARAEWARW